MKRLMKYYIVTGRVIEEVATPLSTKAVRKKPRGVRRAGASSAAKIKANERSSMMRLARGIGANFQAGDGFLTFKYDGAHYPGSMSPGENVPGSEGFEKAEQNLSRFLSKARTQYRRETGKPLRAYWETANWSPRRDAPARLHHHLVVPSDAVELCRKLWPRYGGEGTVIVRDLDSDPDRTRIASYMVANVNGEAPGKKAWSGSRGMDKPVLSEPVEIDSVEEVQAPAGAVIKEVREVTDEDGLVVGKYMRYVLPTAPKLRGGQIVMPRAPRRGGHRI